MLAHSSAASTKGDAEMIMFFQEIIVSIYVGF